MVNADPTAELVPQEGSVAGSGASDGGWLSQIDPTTKDGWRNIGRIAVGAATLGISEIPQVQQAAAWVDPTTKEGLQHLAVVGTVAVAAAATVITAGAAAPAGFGTAAAVLAGTGAAVKGATQIAAVDKAEGAARAAQREATAAAVVAAGAPVVVAAVPTWWDRLVAWFTTGW